MISTKELLNQINQYYVFWPFSFNASVFFQRYGFSARTQTPLSQVSFATNQAIGAGVLLDVLRSIRSELSIN